MPITHHGTTSQTLYARVQTAASTFTACALTEGSSGGLGVYTATDAALVTATLTSTDGDYAYTVRSGSPSATANDLIVGQGVLGWAGTVERPLRSNPTYWNGAAVPAPTTSGQPKVTVVGTVDSNVVELNDDADAAAALADKYATIFLPGFATPLLAVSATADGNTTQTTAVDSTGSDKISVQVGSTTSGGVPTITDNYNNVWTLVDSDLNSFVRSTVYECDNPATGTGHVIRCTLASAGPAIAAIFHKGGLLTGSTDQASTLSSGSSTSSQGGSITPSGNRYLVVTFLATEGTSAVSVGSVDASAAVADNALGGGHIGVGVAYKIQTTAAAINPTWTHGNGVRVARNYSFKVADVAATVRVNQFPSQYTAAIAKDSFSAELEISGVFNYLSAAVAKVEYEIYEHGTTNIVKPFAELSGLAIVGGAFKGKGRFPGGTGGVYYNFAARALDGDGNVIATSLPTTFKLGVGLQIDHLGQSNGQKMYDSYSLSEVANGKVVQHDGEWGAFTAGAPAIVLANRLQTLTDLPIALGKFGVGGQGLINDWLVRTDSSPFADYLAAKALAGSDANAILYDGGETDVEDGVSKATMKAGYVTIYDWIKGFTGRTPAQLPFCVRSLATITGFTDAAASAIRDAQIEVVDENEGMFHAASSIDATLVDQFHENGASFQRKAEREAQAIAWALGYKKNFSGRGPQALLAWRYSGEAKIYVATTATELEQNAVGVPTALIASDDGFSTTLTISSVAYNGGTIEITPSEAPADGDDITLRNCYGQTPTLTRLIYGMNEPGESTIGLPLLPFTDLAVELRDDPEDDDVISLVDMPIKTGTAAIGYELRDGSGQVTQDRSTANISVAGVNELEGTITYAVRAPGSVGTGVAQWDNGEVFRVSSLDAPVSEAGGGGTPADISTEGVHTSRVFVLVHKSTGLISEDTKTISIGDPNTYAIDFRNDAAANQKIYTIDDLDITSGSGSGLTFGTPERDGGTQVRVRITAVTAGNYTVKVPVTYVGGAVQYGYITVKVVQ